MPFNLLKKYPELLEILHLGDKERKASLYRVYRRDIEDNEAFKFREKRVYPIKSDGEIDMQREFMHLTTTDDKEAEGAATKKRVFEPDRSRRLHWIRPLFYFSGLCDTHLPDVYSSFQIPKCLLSQKNTDFQKFIYLFLSIFLSFPVFSSSFG